VKSTGTDVTGYGVSVTTFSWSLAQACREARRVEGAGDGLRGARRDRPLRRVLGEPRNLVERADLRLSGLDLVDELAELVDHPEVAGAVDLHPRAAVVAEVEGRLAAVEDVERAHDAQAVARVEHVDVEDRGGRRPMVGQRQQVARGAVEGETRDRNGHVGRVEDRSGAVDVVDHALGGAADVVGVGRDVVGQAALREFGPRAAADLPTGRRAKDRIQLVEAVVAADVDTPQHPGARVERAIGREVRRPRRVVDGAARGRSVGEVAVLVVVAPTVAALDTQKSPASVSKAMPQPPGSPVG
jgi:hypothetical protein